MADFDLYSKALKHFQDGDFLKSYISLKILCDRYKNTPFNSNNVSTLLQIYFAYDTSVSVIGKKNEYVDKLDIEKLGSLKNFLSKEFLEHVYKIYCMSLLKDKQYKKAEKYMPYLQVVTGPGIRPEDISYFKKNDVGKTLLIYSSGGIGDIIMYSRFLRKVCETQPMNNITFLVDDNLIWIFKNAFTNTNLKFIPTSMRSVYPLIYDYHTNVTMLSFHLNLTYETLYIDYYIKNICGNSVDLTGILDNTKKNVIINWCGNKVNIMEKYNRSIELSKFIGLFKKFSSNINWISIQKNISKEEAAILKEYNIKNCGPIFDNDGNSYKDSVTLLKEVDLVISTDTSIVHLAGTMDVNCWCLLTIGCDWRWRYDKNNWYPKIKVFRQNALSNWDNVVSELDCELTTL
jgi:hypothetical protein